MSAFLRALSAFLAVVLTDTILVCIATIAALTLAGALIQEREQRLTETRWTGVRQPVEARP
jgi:hypothetical protein